MMTYWVTLVTTLYSRCFRGCFIEKKCYGELLKP